MHSVVTSRPGIGDEPFRNINTFKPLDGMAKPFGEWYNLLTPEHEPPSRLAFGNASTQTNTTHMGISGPADNLAGAVSTRPLNKGQNNPSALLLKYGVEM